MHLSRVFAIIATLAYANAWTIPSDAKDGTYAVINRENGEEEHVQVAARNASSLMERAEEVHTLAKRGTQLYCGCGFNMDRGNTDAAVADLSRQLNGHTVQPGSSFYSIRNNVVAFACNKPEGKPFSISGTDYGNYLKRITYVCGAYIAGADLEVVSSNPSVYYAVFGYARYAKGDDFCKAATSSPSSHC